MRLLVSALFLLVIGPSLALGDMQLPGHPRPRIPLDDRNDTIRGFIFGSLAFIVVAALFICVRLKSTSELLPGDILNAVGGHVVLFVRWLDDEKRRAEFYEAEPFSKVIKSERDAAALADSGFVPLRYRRIRE